MPGRNSLMAQKAIECIKNFKEKPKEYQTEYKSRVNAFPAMVLQAGLTQATGFFLAKGSDAPGTDLKKKAYCQYLEDLTLVLKNSGTWSCQNGQKLHEEIITCDTLNYRLLTRDTLQAAVWLKRYCQAFLCD